MELQNELDLFGVSCGANMMSTDELPAQSVLIVERHLHLYQSLDVMQNLGMTKSRFTGVEKANLL